MNYSEAPTIPQSSSSLEKSSVDMWRKGGGREGREEKEVAARTKRIEKYEREVYHGQRVVPGVYTGFISEPKINFIYGLRV